MIGQAAYVVMCCVAWVWGVSQARYALRAGVAWPPPWRATAAVWLVAKAFFLSYVGIMTWEWLSDPPHVYVVVGMALVHLWAFAQWVRLASPDPPSPSPPPMQTVSGITPRERKFKVNN